MKLNTQTKLGRLQKVDCSIKEFMYLLGVHLSDEMDIQATDLFVDELDENSKFYLRVSDMVEKRYESHFQPIVNISLTLDSEYTVEENGELYFDVELLQINRDLKESLTLTY